MGSFSSFPAIPARPRQVYASPAIAAGVDHVANLNLDSLVHEHRIEVAMTSTWTVAPTSIDETEIGRLISKAMISVSGSQDGELFRMDGITARILGYAFDSKVPAAKYSLGTTTTLNFSIELHYANDDSYQRLLTLLNGPANTGCVLTMTFTDNLTQVFGAGTYTAASASYSFKVVSVDARTSSLEVIDPSTVALISSARHFQKAATKSATAAGDIEFDLIVGNRTRALSFVSEASNNCADGLITQISLVIGGGDTEVLASWNALRDQSAMETSIDAAGQAILPFGDPNEDMRGWLDLQKVRQAKIVVTVSGACTVRMGQDFTEGA